jgi:hypothetical protein
MSSIRSGNTGGMAERVRNDAHMLAQLPTDDTFVINADPEDIPDDADYVTVDFPQHIFRRHNQTSVLQTVERVRINGSLSHVWRLATHWQNRITEWAEQRRTLPCGHRPFRNPRGVDGYTCTAEHCDAIHDRETLKRILDGDLE